MKLPEDLLYHPEHTWARVEAGVATVGITDHAQAELGDLVYVEMPSVGTTVGVGDVFGSVESSKSVSELFSPVPGEVVEVNALLEDAPERVNDDPYGEGWIVRIRLDQRFASTNLLGASAYADRIGG